MWICGKYIFLLLKKILKNTKGFKYNLVTNVAMNEPNITGYIETIYPCLIVTTVFVISKILAVLLI